MSTIEDPRQEIDEIDRQIVSLLAARMGLAIKTKQFKSSIVDREREAFVREHWRALARQNNLSIPFIDTLLDCVIAESKHLQSES